MQNQIAVFKADLNPMGLALDHFRDTVGVRIELSTGSWVIFGRVVVFNSDSDSQLANVQLRSRDGSNLIDRAEVRILSGSSQSLSVQGIAQPVGQAVPGSLFEAESLHTRFVEVEHVPSLSAYADQAHWRLT
jgi:hypothetical protein